MNLLVIPSLGNLWTWVTSRKNDRHDRLATDFASAGERLSQAGRRSLFLIRLLAFFLLAFPLVPRAQSAENLPLPTERFDVNGSPAFLMAAPSPGIGKPWVWYAPTLNNLPKQEHAWYFQRLLDKGISVAGINLGEVRGSPASAEKFTGFYDEMVRRGYSPKPVLLGQSRGGLMMLTWAMRHPDKMTAFAGIYPVCNLSSWPMKKSKDFVLKDYRMSEAELTGSLAKFNPIDNLQGLLANKIPLFLVHGNVDTLVPYEENGALLKERYEAGGGTVSVKIIDGEGHKVTPSFFECQELLDFIEKQLK